MDAPVVFSGETAEKRSDLADHMSVSVGEAEVGSDTAEKRSGPADHMGVSVGEAEVETAHKLSSPPEHPRVTRLRHRRLIAFLRDQGFHDSYNELTNKTRAHMSLGHLCGLVERGRWLDAVEYLDRYLPPPTSPKSFRAQVLRHFLAMHHRFANAVAGIVDKSVPRHYLQVNNGRAISHAELRLRSISFSILAVDEVRANMDWEAVRDKASLVVSRVARSTPELRGCIALPATSIKQQHVLPIASGLWSRRRYVKKKHTGRTEAIIRALKRQRPKVPRIGSVEEAQELLADLLETGYAFLSLWELMNLCDLRMKLYDLAYNWSPMVYAVNFSRVRMKPLFLTAKLVTGAQFRQPMFGTSTEAKTSGILADAGAQFRHLMFGTSTEAKTSGTLVNAGTNQHLVEAGCHTNTVREDLDGKRNSRDESTIVGLERELKRHRSTGTFCGASPVMSGPGAVVNLGDKLSGVSSE